ncbi:MAG TPA: DUF2062 domain-containing protein [Agitococcus sp.]|uniref:DUF2062 domain-containing protein n=1 Tax=uncultured Agitococcus sp. TaxID=1506599 RepID=UPI00260ABCFD|nr:DUF2062 domain-containing protein [uncultured Agitococcus sp.]HMY00189.1 DUF2062 domain-containing protein [Agitococcus sp.]HMY82927.1 DUF2062 domain-containing protein [Agitococcus sp.]HNC04363.1 DUF2062 domain-containing protein [Agitococcus sp.]HNC85593.1 DUF2062 domain-containing protein [Agitococcus sp.]HNL80997.1 DUF2062 domain-containing protein [Agitococcus sp.]
MPKKMIRKYLPDPEKIANIQGLGFLRHRLQDPNLWHLNRHSASGAMFWGLWCALLPMPFQMVPAAIAALIFRVNLPLCIVLVWLSNPLTMIPIIYISYFVGASLLNRPMINGDTLHQIVNNLGQMVGNAFSSTPQHIKGLDLSQHLEPILLGTLVTGFLFGCIGYLAMNWYWRYHVTKAWNNRQFRKATTKKEQ